MTRTAFVTRTSASRVTSVPAAVIARVECWANVVLVVFVRGLGLRPRFISYRAFEGDCIGFRTAGAAKLPGQVTDKGGEIYTVQGSKGDIYTVDFAVESCSCPDSVHRGARCKHVIKVGGFIESRRAARELAESKKQAVIAQAAIERAVEQVGRGGRYVEPVHQIPANCELTALEMVAYASCGW